jgi:hypothetical protein
VSYSNSRIVSAGLLLALVSSCSVVHDPSPELDPELSRCPLVDGKTSKGDVLLHYGLPSSEFEGERILVYRMARVGNEMVLLSRTSRWAKEEFNVVLVFNDQHILIQHSILRTRS